MQRLRPSEALYFFCLLKLIFMNGTNYVTSETFERLKVELQHMKGVDRPAASHAIAEAREKGDLKENAEYDAAKEAQGMLEAKIKHLEGVIANARILDENNIDTSKVSILTKVTLTNLNTKKKVTYKIVSENEADLKLGKISVTSPIGHSLLGKLIGDVVEVQVPAGVLKFQIENIEL
jgi:transcription elongation factor GreA